MVCLCVLSVGLNYSRLRHATTRRQVIDIQRVTDRRLCCHPVYLFCCVDVRDYIRPPALLQQPGRGPQTEPINKLQSALDVAAGPWITGGA